METTSILVPGAEGAVLFIHGIVGSPAHFRQVIDLQGRVPEGWSFVNLCLPGHGGTVLDFGRSRLHLWREAAFRAFEELVKTHEKVIIAGHSMGCLFGMQIAIRYPEKVKNLYLLQVPLHLGLRWSGVWRLARIPFGLISKDDPAGSAMLKACGVRTTPWIFQYVTWIPRMVELLTEMHRTSKRVQELAVPSIAFQSRRDEMVSNRSAKTLGRSPWIQVVELEKSTHFYYTPEDEARMIAAFDKLFL